MKHSEKLPLKEGVKRETALTLIESRHVPLLSDNNSFSHEQYKIVENECGELIRLVLYGIAYESQAKKYRKYFIITSMLLDKVGWLQMQLENTG